MFGHWSDFDRTLAAMDQFRRRLEQTFDAGNVMAASAGGGGPRMSLYDAGPNLLLRAEIPGVADKDIQVSLTQDVLTITGERQIDSPQGYLVHRRERLPAKFSRTFALPHKVESEGIAAAMKDGVLTVTLPKARESQPRQIPVKTS